MLLLGLISIGTILGALLLAWIIRKHLKRTQHEHRATKMIRLHASLYPTIVYAMHTIALDRKTVNRLDVFDTTIPDHWVPGLAQIENSLRFLSESELDTFCTGNDLQIRAIAAQTPGLTLARHFLGDYFSGWPFHYWEVESFINIAKRKTT